MITKEHLEPFNRDWLKKEIEGLSKPKICEAAKISKQILYDHLAGKRSLTADNLLKVLRVLMKPRRRLKPAVRGKKKKK